MTCVYQLTGLLYLGLQRRGHHNTSGSDSSGMQPGRMRDAKVKPLFLYSLPWCAYHLLYKIFLFLYIYIYILYYYNYFLTSYTTPISLLLLFLLPPLLLFLLPLYILLSAQLTPLPSHR